MEDGRHSQFISGRTIMTSHWINHLQTLLARFSHLGISGDIDSLTLSESWSLYVYLKRLGNE
jgi:hypothetical protein